jgi:hypothetical protein
MARKNPTKPIKIKAADGHTQTYHVATGPEGQEAKPVVAPEKREPLAPAVPAVVDLEAHPTVLDDAEVDEDEDEDEDEDATVTLHSYVTFRDVDPEDGVGTEMVGGEWLVVADSIQVYGLDAGGHRTTSERIYVHLADVEADDDEMIDELTEAALRSEYPTAKWEDVMYDSGSQAGESVMINIFSL